MMIARKLLADVLDSLSRFPVVGLIGPRQVGKTTLARTLLAHYPDAEYLDLERPSDAVRLHDPELFLRERLGKR